MSASSAAETAPDPAAGAADPVVLKGRFDIWPNAPVPELDSPRARAFAARDRLAANRPVFALVCDPYLPPRCEVLDGLLDFPSPALLRLLDWSVVPWPPGGDHRFALIYDCPPGPRLVARSAGEFAPWPEKRIVADLISPLADLLELLERKNLTHRGIRPDNVFVNPGGDVPVVLGENTSAPPAHDQPAGCEPIPSMQAMRTGRGAGDSGDDVYALGVTALTLFLGADPAAGRSASALLDDKIEKGSYAALAGRSPVPSRLREALRGMLEDRPELRWGVDDVQAWAKDGRLKAMPSMQTERAQRVFMFHGNSYYQPRPLAQAMARHWDAVKLEDKGHEILNWARRALGDDGIAESVLAAMETSRGAAGLGGGGEVAAPPFVARLCQALDHRAPIRYKHLTLHPDALGPVLATGFEDPDTVAAFSEMLLEELPAFRIRVGSIRDGGEAPGKKRFAQLARVLSMESAGYGIERCLYHLNPVQPCLSPLVAARKVMRIEDLLPALEQAAGGRHDGPPFDRHIAAFAAARMQTDIHQLLEAAGERSGSGRAVLGMLGVLATVQARGGPRPYPGVAQWLGEYLSPAVESFHHRLWREQVESELPSMIEAGDLVALYRYLANGDARRRDRKGFANAVAEYANITAEIAYLRSLGVNDPSRAQEYGNQIAAGVTGLLGFVAVLFTLTMM